MVKIISQEQFDKIHHDKQPPTQDKYVGVELEFISQCGEFEMKQYFIHNNLDKYVTIKSDGSVITNRNYRFSYEIAVMAKEREIREIIFKVCSILKNVKSMVNKSCGLHVHIDMRNRDKETIFHNLVTAQPILYAMNPASRLTGSYSHPTRTKEFGHSDLRNGDRTGINPHAWQRHRTFEVRVHAGTLNPHKISNWIALLLQVVEKPVKVEDIKSLEDFREKFDPSKETMDYIEKRLARFGVNPDTLVDIN